MMLQEQMNEMTIRSMTMMKMKTEKKQLTRSASTKVSAKEERSLDMRGMSLVSLPTSFINLSSISKLLLSNNNLQNIPESLVARMLNVTVLDLHSNQLKTLPNSIGCLSKLEILNVSGNFLQSLPKTIEDCRSLEELNANFNELTRLPDAIGFELTKLKKLSVNSNKLVALPNSVSHLTSLRVLDARLNRLRSLPEDLENLVNLQVLNVSQNFRHLTELPYSVGLLLSLVELDVSYNGITMLPHSIGCLRRIEKLSVQGNPLVSPPFELVEQGLEAVKQYMCEKMNAPCNTRNRKKPWGLGQLVKHRTFHGLRMSPSSPGRHSRRQEEDGQGFINVSDYRLIDGLASPRHLSLLNPRRILSPLAGFFSPPRF